MPGKSKRKILIGQLEELALLEEICPEQDSNLDSDSSSNSDADSGTDSSNLGSDTDDDEAFFTSPLYLLSTIKSI